jgi:hypothetical protein
LLTVNYYDTYSFPAAATAPATVESQTVLNGTIALKNTSNRLMDKVVTTLASTNGETATTFYDIKSKTNKIYSTNFLEDIPIQTPI